MYSIHVGNIGQVWQGANPVQAQKEYAAWLKQSKGETGRAIGESVSLFRDGEPLREYDPDKGFYYVEFTDTFGGEANYCWVRRYKVKAATKTGAIRKAARDMGYSGRMRKDYDSGDMVRYNVRGACVCAFVQWYDADMASHYSMETI